MAKRKAKAPTRPEEPDQEEFDFSHSQRGDSVTAKRVTWEWKGRIRANALNIIDGDPGTGKSTLLTVMASTIANGGKFLRDPGTARPGTVLWMCTEEEYDTDVVPRWLANCGQLKNLFNWPNPRLEASERISMPHDVFKLTAYLKHIGARVLVLDPFTSLAPFGLEMNTEQAVRGYLESIFAATAPVGVTTLMSRHWNKNANASPLNRGLGSIGISAVCRVIMAATMDPDSGKPGILSTLKTNNADIPPPISYRIDETPKGTAWFQWGTLQDKTAGEIISQNAQGGEEDAANDAIMMLLKILKNGKVEANAIVKEALSVGISVSTLRRAKKKLKIKSQRVSKGSKGEGMHYWLPPSVPTTPSRSK